MAPTTTSRLTAGALAVLAAVTATRLVGGVPGYLAVLVAVVTVASLAVAGRLWSCRSLGARVWATLLASIILCAQVLGASVGGPAGEGAQWDATVVCVLAVALLVLVLVAVDARVTRVPAAEERPYAL